MKPISWRYGRLLTASVLMALSFSQVAPLFGQPEKKKPRTFEIPGQVEASEQTKLYAKVAGYVQKIHVDIGDRVRAGQVLAELAVPELEAEFRHKETQIAQAEAKTELARRSVKAAETARVLREA